MHSHLCGHQHQYSQAVLCDAKSAGVREHVLKQLPALRLRALIGELHRVLHHLHHLRGGGGGGRVDVRVEGD